MQALILAAGRGSRLGKITDLTPKCLLQIGGRPIVAHQLEALAEAGVAPVAMVVGYCADEIRAVVGIRAEYIDNPKWSATNSLYSFTLARAWIKGPLVILNSDVVFHPEILHRVLAAGDDAVAYDSSSGNAPEHMKVRVVDGQLIDMDKAIEPGLSSGENVGILCFTEETVQRLLDRAQTLLSAGGEQAWLGAAVRELTRERKVRAVDVAGLPWAEIDSAQDLETTRREVWPAIQKGRSRILGIGRGVAVVLFLLLTFGVFVLGIRVVRPAPGESWELVELSGAPTINLMAGDCKQTWWMLAKDATVEESVGGPGRLRIDSRLLLEKGVEQTVPYMLMIELDDELIDWFRKSGKPSETWDTPDWTVSKLRSTEIELPSGTHTVQIAFMSTCKGPACAVRLQRPELKDPD